MEKKQKPKKSIFKLIAIQPINCDQCILKNLKQNEIYYFYNGYTINENEISFDEKLMNDDFYNLEKSKLNISIHTIVGKNGSGKSAVVELLMRTLNNIAFIFYDKEKDPLTSIYPTDNLETNLFYQIDQSFYKIHLKKLFNQNIVTADFKTLNSKEKECDLKSIESSFFENFFYSIIVNYSIYAYNGNDFGDAERFDSGVTPEGMLPLVKTRIGDKIWIDGIMHKNDGYSAPVVIHPQRYDGNMDINNEKHLTISRLLSLFVKMDKDDKILRILNGKNEISKVQFFMNSKDLNSSETGENASTLNYFFQNIPNNYLFSIDIENNEKFKKFKLICEIIFKKWIQIFKLSTIVKNISFKNINDNIEYNYLVYKTMVIINRYLQIIAPDSKNNYHFDASYRLTDLSDDELINAITIHVYRIFQDDSHITLKLKQTLNYIKYTKKNYQKDIDENYDKKYSEGILFSEYSPNEFSDSLNKFKKKWGTKASDILYFMPPPFLKTKIFYKDTESKVKDSEEYPFEFLSSGEKQFTFFITTILYHLRNIESAHRSVTERRKYKNINLIFEEIELYFHPEMQRKLIDDIITSLRSMNFKHIKNINICLITHSPIILSDIPTSNGLFLKDGTPEMIGEETFASNIYSLFRNAFFLDGAPIGEFAVKKIKKICEKIERKELSEQELYREIQLIGDPIIKNQVFKLFEKRFNSIKKIQELEKEIKQLKLKLNDQNK